MKRIFIASMFVMLMAGNSYASDCSMPKSIKKNKWVDVTLNNGTILHGKVRKVSKTSCSFTLKIKKEYVEVSADQVILVKKSKK